MLHTWQTDHYNSSNLPQSLRIHQLLTYSCRSHQPRKRSCTRHMLGQRRNLQHPLEASCCHLQLDDEGYRFRARTRRSDFQIPFCKIPTQDRSLLIHPFAFETRSIHRHQLSCHTALEWVLRCQGRPGTLR